MATTTTGGGGATNLPATLIPTCGGVISNSTFTFIGPPLPFPAPPRSVDFSPLKFVLAVFAVIAVPILAYVVFLAVTCSSGGRRRRSSGDVSSPPPPSPPVVIIDVELQSKPQPRETGSECSVCLTALNNGEDVRQLRPCKHSFHASCIGRWLADNSNCPICRAAVNVNVDGNRYGGGGGNGMVTVIDRVDDWHHGLPDASSLV